MPRLRAEIEKLIAKTPPEELAMELCCWMGIEFDLDGNGWFDDDEEYQATVQRKNDKWLAANHKYRR